MKIFLNKNSSKESINVNNSLTVSLKGGKRMLPLDPIEDEISEIKLYNEERNKSNKIRLTVSVNPICSNVLHNLVTEIVKNEGSNSVVFFNKAVSEKDIKTVFVKDKNFFIHGENGDIHNATKDTQLSSVENGFIYHCGVDIFNNHYLRSLTFKAVCPLFKSSTEEKNNFNTISDTIRNHDGKKILMNNDNGELMPMHLYLNEEILTFKECVDEKLIEKNGWFGFINSGKMKIYNKDYECNWEKAINYMKPCDFIDMYPERELFYFNPKYNKFRRREEKNWNYCITYPSKNITDGISFIKTHKDGTTSLKIVLFDDNNKDVNGTDSIIFYSASYHGLSKGDYINIYSDEKLIISNAEVINVFSNYSFAIFSNGIKISDKWSSIYDLPEGYDVSDNKKIVTFRTEKDEKIYYTLYNKRVNIDDNAQNISFSRVIEGKTVDYYVRIFSKLPNWKFSKKKINDDVANDKEYMKEYQKCDMEFESHVGKLGFSKNIYGDDISEIVFTDDIDISNLKDNLGRPLSTIYLTIIKNNSGYKKWYGKKNKQMRTNDDDIEFSHCFGKVNCSFRLSKESAYNDLYSSNIFLLNNVDGKHLGLSTKKINGREQNDDDDDEILYKEDLNFYGDLCCFSNSTCDEQIIQDVDFRFNTAQRELTSADTSSSLFAEIHYDEIKSDDYDSTGFKVESHSFNELTRKEGYYYKAHYPIQIKTFSTFLTTEYPSFYSIYSIENGSDNTIIIKSLKKLFFSENELIFIYDKDNRKLFKYKVKTVNTDKTLELSVDCGDELDLQGRKKDRFIIFTIPESIPNYAQFSNDNTCRFIWREILQNGFDKNSENEIYPFTNGSLYVNKNINLYLRRQNPSNTGYLKSNTYPYDHKESAPSYGVENKYYNEEDIEC